MTSTQTVEIPNTLNFTIQGLEANTQYSIVAVGRYQSVSGFTDGLEEVPGQSIMTQTRGNFKPCFLILASDFLAPLCPFLKYITPYVVRGFVK